MDKNGQIWVETKPFRKRFPNEPLGKVPKTE